MAPDDPTFGPPPPATPPPATHSPATSPPPTDWPPNTNSPSFAAPWETQVVYLPPAPKRKRPIGTIITIILLCLALIGAVTYLTIYVIKLGEANDRIAEQDQEISDQRDQIDEQETYIEQKETFGAAMNGLLDKAREFDGALMQTLVPFSQYESVAAEAWENRRNVTALAANTETVLTFTQELETTLSDAATQRSTNITGTTYESVTDRLGNGYVASVLDDADALCKQDVLACVTSSNPFTVHFDAQSHRQPHITDWIRTGIAYHEFAHVLQFTNPDPTSKAVKAFDGDVETMADCFALTFLDGWTLDHVVWQNSSRYWNVSIGYGYTCNSSQRQVIKDWYDEVGFTYRPITQ